MEITFIKKECRPGYGEVKVMAEYLVQHDDNRYTAYCQVVGIESCCPEIRVESVELPKEKDQNEATLTEESIMDLIQDELADLKF